MNFRRGMPGDEPEINLIPLIDVLLVILIFLAATTSFTRYRQLQLTLPEASGEIAAPKAINLAISQEGLYALNGQLLSGNDPAQLTAALRASVAGQADPVLVINADERAAHGAVVHVMEAARLAGIEQVNFATQQGTP
ncbi:biopolymer transporter ExbD [Pusillimonas sp. TS35]|uniref:ExbD/TolR family protein n=1 Tax=Paracandidimonas lactea TaxID=2895524 RepID=UPI00136A10A7|nr:biopolymer transporter ExbD [Paracandidimonas lactea]MYN14716.1 biopolymer transporter ExbD [Pusillimonas sp. TS35]